MTVDVFAALILLAAGIGLSEAYHARQRVIMRTLRGKPIAGFSRQHDRSKRETPKKALPIDCIIRTPPYPAPAARLYYPHEKVVSLDGWRHQDSLRKITQRWQVHEGRAG